MFRDYRLINPRWKQCSITLKFKKNSAEIDRKLLVKLFKIIADNLIRSKHKKYHNQP